MIPAVNSLHVIRAAHPAAISGFVPLAYLLKNAGVDTLPGVAGIYKKKASDPNAARFMGGKYRDLQPVDPMAQVHKYVDYILAHQNKTDGWLGPDTPSQGGVQYWGPSNVLFALIAFAEGQGDAATHKTVTQAILSHLLEQKKRMVKAPLASWASARWIDIGWTVAWVLDNGDKSVVSGHEADLMQLGVSLHSQGADWDSWFSGTDGFKGAAGGHNVNNAQALKSAAVWYRFSKNETMHKLSVDRMANMDAAYGLPTGMFNGDEILPSPPSRNPSRGIETCGVVEAMWSYTTMGSTHGDMSFFDRAERIAYNALPATWASPRGGDMWAHQYLQAINEINAIKADPHVWTHDGDMAETYGLEPNYGCCTANFNQGWPKFANMVVMATPDKGAAVAILAPASAKLANGMVVDIETSYPFEDTVTVSCTGSGPLYIRVPAWATKATIGGKAAKAGAMVKGACGSKMVLELNPEITIETWAGDKLGGAAKAPAYSVVRGPLLYSLPIDAKYEVYGHHFGSGDEASNDYYVTPTSPWAYALDADQASPASSLTYKSNGYAAGAAPFNHTGWPCMIEASVSSLPSWGEAINSAAPPPKSPACTGDAKDAGACGAPKKVMLVPHGGTELRIGMFPLSGK